MKTAVKEYLMNLKTKLIAAAVISVVSFGSLAAKPGKGKGHDPEKRLERMKAHLQLTDEQFKKIKSISENYREKREDLREKMKSLHETLADLMTAEQPDKSKIRSTMQGLSELRISMKMLMIDQRLEMQSVMTEEQRSKWLEHMKQHREKMKKEWKEKHGRD